MHTMGLFLLADVTHAGFDNHRNKIFWEGQGTKKKFHLIKWQDICQPKSHGGLGVINTKAMNIAVMSKWIWRIYSGENEELLLVGCSPFWHSIHKVKNHFKLEVKFFPGSNSNISFWKDTWIREEPLSVRFPTLFEKSSDSYLNLAHAYTEEGWWIPFRMNLDQEYAQSWLDLCSHVEEIELEDSLP
jgi:hypothetical protein